MSPVSSPDSPSGDQLAEAPLAEAPVTLSPGQTRVSFRDARLRPMLRPALCCAGALGVGLALAPLLLKPGAAPTPGDGSGGPQVEIALSSADTVLVTPAMPPGALLRGRIRLVAGETEALGRAPVGGLVARHLVESGARVQRGDAVVEISSGAGQRAVPASEFRQDRAEKGQIAASNAQGALAQRISIAQTQLRAAQERVARSQAQVGVARDVVRRLQNGQSVSPGEIPAPQNRASSAESRANRRKKTGLDARQDRASQIAARQADAARQAAQESARALETARTMLADAQTLTRQAEQRKQSTTQAVADVEARFDDKKATGADVEAARAAQKEAQNAVEAAAKALVSAQTEIVRREKNAATAQNYAQSSAAQAAKTLKGAQGDVDSTPNSPDAPATEAGTKTGAPAPRVTLESAIQFAGAALEESRRASRDAERIHSEIEAYQGQVTRSKTRIDAATQNLAAAQQQVMDSVPRPRFSASYAPSSGIVTWISRLAREVNQGTPVFGITRSQRAAARFEDKSGLWRAIKPGAILSAFVVDAPAPADKPGPTVGPETVAQLGAGHAMTLKMTEIQTPTLEDEAAKLTGTPILSQGSAAGLSEGAQILVSMPRPGQKPTLSVPASALVQRGKAMYVALLEPLSANELAAQNLAATPAATPQSENKAPLKTEVNPPKPDAVEAFHLRWTPVETGRSDGLRLEITKGLQAGARVVSAPEDLEAMGFAPAASPTVLDAKNPANPDSQASDLAQNVPVPDVLVRLSTELA